MNLEECTIRVARPGSAENANGRHRGTYSLFTETRLKWLLWLDCGDLNPGPLGPKLRE